VKFELEFPPPLVLRGGLGWGLCCLQMPKPPRDRAPTLTLPRSTRGGENTSPNLPGSRVPCGDEQLARFDSADVPAASVDPTTPIITSAGLITALGATSSQSWNALLAGNFISDHARVPIDSRGGEARVIALARAAIREARLETSARNFHAPERTALIVGTSKGPIEQWLPPTSHMSMSPYVAGGLSPSGLGQIAEEIGAELALRGPRLTISAACASGLVALIRAAMLIRNNEADCALVVAAEASVHRLFLGSFRRLGVLPKTAGGCRPFDEHREGFLMSEAAAAVWLERADRLSSQTEGSSPPTRLAIDGFSLGADATHLTGMDPTGRVLRRVITSAVGDRPLDLIHAHGTGTMLNDPVELAAINDAIAAHADVPEIYSHKGALGHSLGASGLVSVAINYLIHSHGLVPPNVKTTSPIAAGRLRIEQNVVRRPVKRSLAIAAGFGGAIAAVTLQTLGLL
jgi:3-oxoacyl-[acyl-carrier-protein] synthase II